MNTDRIDFISAYCDRWCERCAFTDRCSTFACSAAIAMCGDDAAGIELIGEIFNLFNRVNIDPNASRSESFPPDANGQFNLPPQRGGRFILPRERFRSAFAPRQFQVGFRFIF